jgi:hypothetical protein
MPPRGWGWNVVEDAQWSKAFMWKRSHQAWDYSLEIRQRFNTAGDRRIGVLEVSDTGLRITDIEEGTEYSAIP